MRTKMNRKKLEIAAAGERIITVPRNALSDARATFFFVLTSRVARFLESRSRGARDFSANAEQHRAGERSFRQRNGVEQSERQPARPAQQRKVVAEQADESVRERDTRHPIRPPAARNSGRASRRPPIFSRGVSSTICASSHASRRPRLKPWPATGCSVCAALPSATQRARAAPWHIP
jgi:hypothetical protein